MKSDFKGLARIILTVLLSSPASATTLIYSTLDGSNGYDCCVSWTVAGGSSVLGSNSQQSVGSGFTSPGNYSVTQIDLGLGWFTGTNGANVSLWTDLSGLPGSQLGSWSLSNLPVAGTTNTTLKTISGISGLNLSSGDSYFLIVDPGAADTWAGWNQNDAGGTGITGPFIFSSDGDATWNSHTDILGAFDVFGNAVGSPVGVPEPGSLAIIGAGLLGLAGLRRRRKAGPI